MFHPPDRPSLSDLFDARSALRRQEVVLMRALRDVQDELRGWDSHRLAQQAAGQGVPRELCRIWAELAERERELAILVLQARSELHAAQRELQARLTVRPIAS